MKYEFKGTLLKEFKKALKEMASHIPEESPTVLHGASYSYGQLLHEVETGSEIGRDYIAFNEDICNRRHNPVTPEQLFKRMRNHARQHREQKPAP